METQIIFQAGLRKTVGQTDDDLQQLPGKMKHLGVVYFITVQQTNSIANLDEKHNRTATK